MGRLSLGEFDGSFISWRKGHWVYQYLFIFQFFHRFWPAKEDMDCFCLFLEFSQIGSGIRQVPCPPPTNKDCRGYVNLCPANVAYGADQAGRIIIATNRLVVLGAETPHVATLAKVLWAGVVEIVADLVVQGLGGWGAHGCRSIGVVSSAGVPFCRCDFGFGRVAPASVPSSLSLRIDHGMGDRCVAVCRNLDHHCAVPAEIYVYDSHLISFCVEEESARAHLPHLYSSGEVGHERTSRDTRLSRV